MMIGHANEIKKGISKNLVDQKKCLTVKMLRDMFDQLRGVMMIAYPGYHGVPEWEPAREILEGQYDIVSSQSEQYDVSFNYCCKLKQFLDPKDTSLWWAGKELLPGKVLSEYTGKNEKTKIV